MNTALKNAPKPIELIDERFDKFTEEEEQGLLRAFFSKNEELTEWYMR